MQKLKLFLELFIITSSYHHQMIGMELTVCYFFFVSLKSLEIRNFIRFFLSLRMFFAIVLIILFIYLKINFFLYFKTKNEFIQKFLVSPSLYFFIMASQFNYVRKTYFSVCFPL